MIPFSFGAPGRRLFGIYHPAAGRMPAPCAVLLCNPFGQEAMRAHRLLRVLADRLCRTGVPVLRFDFHGTGDSPGADEDGDLDGWRSDVLAAHDELMNRSSALRIRWMGARLGATLAVQASHAAEVERLVLWEPVVDGAQYLRMLRGRHVDALEEAFSLPDPAWRGALESDAEAFTQEALGFGISPALRRQIFAVTPASLDLPAGAQAHVVADPGDADVWDWQRRNAARSSRPHAVPLAHDFDWTASGALNSALVPAEAVQRLMGLLSE